MRTKFTRRGAVVGALAAVSFVGAGVASATTPPTEPTETTDSATASPPSTAPTGSSPTEGTATESSATDSSTAPAGEPTGPICAAAAGGAKTDMGTSDTTASAGTMAPPGTMATGDTTASSDAAVAGTTGTADTTATDSSMATGGGSMADSPVATAAGMSPLLSTLVSAVDAAGLVDTLNDGGPFTVLAPINSAFDKLDPDTLAQVLDDPSGLLTTVLTYHVIPEQLSMADLASGGSFATVQGDDVTFEMRGDTLVVNDGAAAVQCADLPTANATVFLIDSVLSPPSLTAPPTTDGTTGAADGTETTTATSASSGDTGTVTTGTALGTETTTATTES